MRPILDNNAKDLEQLMTKQQQYFGTDGIRGRVGQYPITPEFVLKLGWAVGRILRQKDQDYVLIGKDTRISGYMFESALEAGLSAAGMNVRLLGPMPTPGIAYLTRTFHARAGIVVSASHNAFHDNGIKFFSTHGKKLPDETELAIEAEMGKTMTTVASEDLGKAKRIDDASGRYIEHCKSSIPPLLSLSGLKIILDCAHGATYHIAPAVFRELGAKVTSIGADPDGININAERGATSPKALQAAVLEHQADLGIAFDGDGDRVMMVDEGGTLLNGDDILYILANAWQKKQILTGPVVGTVMSNLGLEHALKQKGIGFERAQVGDRYVLEQLEQHGGILGGESSGHVLCLNRTTTGDGIVTALQVLCEIIEQGLSLHDLKTDLYKYPQRLINVELPVEPKIDPRAILRLPMVKEAMQAAEAALADKGRILLRPSGTEPLIRVMVEGQSRADVDTWAKELASVIQQSI